MLCHAMPCLRCCVFVSQYMASPHQTCHVCSAMLCALLLCPGHQAGPACRHAPHMVVQADPLHVTRSLAHHSCRYGQTALHVAARKAGPSLLRSLVDAGGAASLLAADADGRLPLDIAKRNNNGSALRVLADAGGALAAMRREQARQRSTMPTAERPRNNDHRQQHPPQRWVGRRLQQRKGAGGSGAQGGSSGGSGAGH